MDLTKLSKSDLFIKCEELGITKYKSKNKQELIKLISHKQDNNIKEVVNNIKEINNNIIDLTKLSKSDFFIKCEELGISKYKSKNKLELIKLIENKTREQNNNIKEVSNNNFVFSLDDYFVNITEKITDILSRPDSLDLTYDIFDTHKSKINKLIVLKEKQRQMKIGEIVQVMLGNYGTFIDLGKGHKSGLDIMSIERKIIMELKNRTNTDNSSSKKTNLEKLAKFKINNPEYTCIYGCINDDTEDKTKEGKHNLIQYNNVELNIYTGSKLLDLVLDNNKNIIINYVRDLIDKLT
jgi:hypothetical protein